MICIYVHCPQLGEALVLQIVMLVHIKRGDEAKSRRVLRHGWRQIAVFSSRSITFEARSEFVGAVFTSTELYVFRSVIPLYRSRRRLSRKGV